VAAVERREKEAEDRGLLGERREKERGRGSLDICLIVIPRGKKERRNLAFLLPFLDRSFRLGKMEKKEGRKGSRFVYLWPRKKGVSYCTVRKDGLSGHELVGRGEKGGKRVISFLAASLAEGGIKRAEILATFEIFENNGGQVGEEGKKKGRHLYGLTPKKAGCRAVFCSPGCFRAAREKKSEECRKWPAAREKKKKKEGFRFLGGGKRKNGEVALFPCRGGMALNPLGRGGEECFLHERKEKEKRRRVIFLDEERGVARGGEKFYSVLRGKKRGQGEAAWRTPAKRAWFYEAKLLR